MPELGLGGRVVGEELGCPGEGYGFCFVALVLSVLTPRFHKFVVEMTPTATRNINSSS